jgi:hypothetical protein
MTTREEMREQIRIRGRCVKPVTQATFPIGVPVEVHAIVDTKCGWEFDAPMHIMRPFHQYCIVSSISERTLEAEIEDILIDLDLGVALKPDSDAWPYTGDYLKRVFRQVVNGKQLGRFWHLVSKVTVQSWSKNADDCVRYKIKTKMK